MCWSGQRTCAPAGQPHSAPTPGGASAGRGPGSAPKRAGRQPGLHCTAPQPRPAAKLPLDPAAPPTSSGVQDGAWQRGQGHCGWDDANCGAPMLLQAGRWSCKHGWRARRSLARARQRRRGGRRGVCIPQAGAQLRGAGRRACESAVDPASPAGGIRRLRRPAHARPCLPLPVLHSAQPAWWPCEPVRLLLHSPTVCAGMLVQGSAGGCRVCRSLTCPGAPGWAAAQGTGGLLGGAAWLWKLLGSFRWHLRRLAVWELLRLARWGLP